MATTTKMIKMPVSSGNLQRRIVVSLSDLFCSPLYRQSSTTKETMLALFFLMGEEGNIGIYQRNGKRYLCTGYKRIVGMIGPEWRGKQYHLLDLRNNPALYCIRAHICVQN
ncbi:MAG: hypothetical protein H6642_09850 [Caldilineaceae bacterium]|nr:hypothetical protein [Caldilineaceae bacterium]